MSPRLYGGNRGERRFGREAAYGAVILGIALSQCTPRPEQATPSPDFPSTPTSFPTETPFPNVDEYEGVPDQQKIEEALGSPSGFGGLGAGPEQVFLTQNIKDQFNRLGLAPIYERLPDGRKRLTQTLVGPQGERFCVPNLTPTLYNPYVEGEADYPLEKVERSFAVVPYGGKPVETRLKVISGITLVPYAENLICVNAIVSDPNSPDGWGALMTTLVNKETGEILGTLHAAYSTDDRVEVDQRTGELKVNGNRQWFSGDGMATLAEMIEPVVLPNGSAMVWDSQVLQYRRLELPANLAQQFSGAKIEIDEKGNVVALGRYDKATYRGGEWLVIPRFETCLDQELQTLIKEDFLAKSGISVEQALDRYRRSAQYTTIHGYGGLGQETFWATAWRFLNVGLARVSIANLSGSSQNDYVHCVFTINPDADPNPEDPLLPFVVGVQWQGVWVATTPPVFKNSKNPNPSETYNAWFTSPEDLEKQFSKQFGAPVDIAFILRFRDLGDWSRKFWPDFRSVPYPNPVIPEPPEQLLWLMDAMAKDKDPYYERYTRDPSQLGQQTTPPPGGGEVGEHINWSNFISQFGPSTDIGLIPRRIDFLK